MRIIEGTPEELVQYEQLVGAGGRGPMSAAPARSGEDAPVGAEPPSARTAVGDLAGDDEDSFFIRQYVYGRATNATTARLVLTFLERIALEGTVIEVGVSERTADGLTDYVMVRDSGPRHFGAVVYVKPGNGGLTLRLQPEDVTDVADERVKQRNVKAGHQYAITCRLVDQEAVDLAIDLTRQALTKVRQAK